MNVYAPSASCSSLAIILATVALRHYALSILALASLFYFFWITSLSILSTVKSNHEFFRVRMSEGG